MVRLFVELESSVAPPRQTSFLLTKWYLDCVSDSGDTAIVYVADLRWNTLSIHYGSLLTVLNGKVSSAFSLHGTSAPESSNDIIQLRQPGLEVEGEWKRLRPPVRRTVFENLQGAVDWNCLQPMSEVELRLRGGIRLRGLGYAECLTLSLFPWQLPLSSLNWGRFLSSEDAIVWIDWKGTDWQGTDWQGTDWQGPSRVRSSQKRSVIHNGEEHQAVSIADSEVVFSETGSRLELDRGLVLREGRLGDTVLPGISRLAGLLPRSLLSVHEHKWRSRGVFRTANREQSGWAIHEVVKWKE